MAWYDGPISHGYITQYNPGQWDTPHFADDIPLPVDTPITSLFSGTVLRADYAVWNGQPGGGEVFIQPDGGGPEEYFYHLDLLGVSPGQHVQVGQQVGLSGGQNSGGHHPTSPMWSSGPHVHAGYFTGFVSTPVGNRPYGPDFLPAIQAARNGTTPPPPTGGPPGGINFPITIDFCTSFPALCQFTTWIATINWQDVGIRALLIIVGIVLVWIGADKFFSGNDINISSPPTNQSSSGGEKTSQPDRGIKNTNKIAPPPPKESTATEVGEVAAA